MGWLSKVLNVGSPKAGPATGRPRAPERPTGPADHLAPARHQPPTPSPLQPSAWTATTPTLRPIGYTRVVGESHYQVALTRVAAAAPDRLVLATLVRDRKNPHHSGAIAVFVGPDHVGFIAWDELAEGAGQSLYRAMARLADAGRPVTSWARITGGTTGAPSFGVVLLTRMWDQPDEPWPFPITMPTESYATVRGTDDHQSLLRGHLGRKTETHVGVTLREGPGDATPVRSAPTIVVACDGVVIGARPR